MVDKPCRDYVLDSQNTVHDFLDEMSKDYNYNFFRHTVRLCSGKESKNIYDFTTKLRDLPIYTESYFFVDISPKTYELYKKDGYTSIHPPSK
jgi:hypothetical protein